MSVGARVFVAVVFGILGLSFLVTTAALALEFGDLDWFAIATFYSHLFIFFPTAGLLALVAFYVPAAVFVDLYWRHVRWGRIRFVVGTLVLALASVGLARVILSSKIPTVWELKPETLLADEGSPRRCAGVRRATGGGDDVAPLPPRQCRRVPPLDAVLAVRTVSQTRTGLSQFARDCAPDPYVTPADETGARRFCFPSRSFATTAECCASLQQLSLDIAQMYAAEDGDHSLTGRLHHLLLPLKVFFLLVLLVIGVLLAVWRKVVDVHFPFHARRIERGVLVGAVAMLLWPVTNQAFLQAASLVYGDYGDSAYAKLSPMFSLVFGIWALLLVLFFFRQHERDLEAAGKIFGGVASVIAVMKYNQIVDYSVRYVGSGSSQWEVVALCALVAVGIVALVWSAAVPETPSLPHGASEAMPGGEASEQRGGPT